MAPWQGEIEEPETEIEWMVFQKRPPGDEGEDENLAYVARTLVVGGTPPYLVSLSAGALPDGLSLDPVEGVLSGTPTVAGSFAFTVEVSDFSEVTVSQPYTLLIVDPLRITTADLPPATEKAA